MKSPKNVQPDKDEKRSCGDRPSRENTPWHFSMGYLGIALLVLMIWHVMMNASGSRSIPYSEFKKHVDDIAWETEVWLSDTPDHMIHFNGDRFIGPRK